MTKDVKVFRPVTDEKEIERISEKVYLIEKLTDLKKFFESHKPHGGNTK